MEAHLLDSAAALEVTGLERTAAERAAVAAFGAPEVVADTPAVLDLRSLLRPAVLFAAVGLVAIGVSGLVSEVMGRVWGAGFVAGDLPGATYTPARCAELEEYFPGHGCLSAAARHHWGEVVEYRVAAGVLGLVLLVVWRFLPQRGRLPSGYVAVAGVVVFGLGAAALAVETLDTGTGGWGGVGQWLSAAVVAALVALGYAVRLTGDLRPPRPPAVGRGRTGR
ncbi:hypothetical protein EKO23_10975 [Nocardioides guangzhouensis]|uniref:Uncharacterized protein n=1 Tax=Nocardioides guangzhouensis TaxID=2497878 RepID=A0A4Q4ZEL2_9ACTN|nr:hypothetical protein [Nocardioides guangzhouensis]RYP85831.1 hypothetical protein EKO23_10975 [Nocardioides guangzhouensis]